MIIELKNVEDFLMIIQDLVDPKYSFGVNNELKDLTLDEVIGEESNTIRKSKALHLEGGNNLLQHE